MALTKPNTPLFGVPDWYAPPPKETKKKKKKEEDPRPRGYKLAPPRPNRDPLAPPMAPPGGAAGRLLESLKPPIEEKMEKNEQAVFNEFLRIKELAKTTEYTFRQIVENRVQSGQMPPEMGRIMNDMYDYERFSKISKQSPDLKRKKPEPRRVQANWGGRIGYQIGGPVQQRMPQGMPPQGLPPMPPQGMQMPLQGMPPMMPQGYQIGGPVQQRMPPQGMPFDPNLGQPLPPQGMPPMMPPQGMPPPRGLPPRGMPMMPQRGIASFNSGGPALTPEEQAKKEFFDKIFARGGASVGDFPTVKEAKAGRKAKRKEKRKARKAGKPKITEEAGLAAPWVIEEEIMRPSGMQLGGPVQQRMPPQGMPFDPNLGQPLPPQGMPPMVPQGMPMPPPRGMPQGMPMMPQRGIASFVRGGPAEAPSSRSWRLKKGPSIREKIEESRPSSGSFTRFKGLPSIEELNKRLKKLEGQSISDKDLDEMTKSSSTKSDKYTKEKGERGVRAEPMSLRGVSSLKEKDFDYASPQQQENMISEIRKGLEDPTRAMSEGATLQEVETLKSMTDAQILEFIEAMNQEAMDQDTGEETLEDKALSLIEPDWADYPTPFNNEVGWRERLNQLGDPKDINIAPTGLNKGGAVKYYNRGGLASMGRGGDSQLAHVMPGERMVPPGVMDDSMLDAAFVKAGLDPREYTVGSAQASTNPMTGVPEYGLSSFIKRLFKKVKKLAPVIGSIVGFSYGGATGAGIGKALGGIIKTGDVDFQAALTDFGTGWALGNFAKGVGLQEGSVFKKASEGGMWGLEEKAGDDTLGGFIQSAGAKLSGAEDIDLMDRFKDLSTGKKLGVIALGLGALSQTGMFDKEELGDIPPELRAKQQDIYDYVGQPLRPAVQGEWGAGPTTSPKALTDWKNRIAKSKSQKTKSSLADFFENKIGLTGYPAFS